LVTNWAQNDVWKGKKRKKRKGSYLSIQDKVRQGRTRPPDETRKEKGQGHGQDQD
jgi:hypothetical protein